MVALGLAVVFIYFILASQFASFLQPVAIMASLPFTLVGVMAALILTGSTLNLFSIIGFIMLMGLVVKNAILLVDFANQSQREGLNQHDAVLRNAGQVRLRPIIMTTLAMIFGMLPMAIGWGEGSEAQAPMGRAVIGGLITSTLLTLVVVPVLLHLPGKLSALVEAAVWGQHRSIRCGLGQNKQAQAAVERHPVWGANQFHHGRLLAAKATNGR
jgi:HAE1 family hydrophobic/amphiphilic exporter-1